MTDTDTINIDDTGEVRLLEMPARVEMIEGHRHPRLIPANGGKWLSVLSRHLGKPGLRVVLLRAKQRRSQPQNRYLWGVVYVDVLEGMREKAIECGFEPPFASVDDVHEWGKWRFLRVKRVFPGGEIEEVAGSTRTTLERFADYVSQLSAWAGERGIYIRQPHEEVSA